VLFGRGQLFERTCDCLRVRRGSGDRAGVLSEAFPDFFDALILCGIGKLGTALGDAGINIATFNLGRRKARGDAAALIAVDGEIGPDVLETLGALDGVRKVVPLSF